MEKIVITFSIFEILFSKIKINIAFNKNHSLIQVLSLKLLRAGKKDYFLQKKPSYL